MENKYICPVCGIEHNSLTSLSECIEKHKQQESEKINKEKEELTQKLLTKNRELYEELSNNCEKLKELGYKAESTYFICRLEDKESLDKINQIKEENKKKATDKFDKLFEGMFPFVF